MIARAGPRGRVARCLPGGAAYYVYKDRLDIAVKVRGRQESDEQRDHRRKPEGGGRTVLLIE
jgi:hypothetical protein